MGHEDKGQGHGQEKGQGSTHGKSHEKKIEKVLKYQLAPKANGKIPFGLELAGFLDGSVTITDEILQGPHADKIIRAIQNWENETGNTVLGTSIVLK